MSRLSKMGDIALDAFALRQFSASYTGTKIPIPPSQFLSSVLSYYNERAAIQSEFPDRPVLIDGYAPFCKHIFMPNFLDEIHDDAIPITSSNEHLLRTKYEARTKDELPVLIRYFPKDKVQAPRSKFLDLILYSREQIEKENKAMNRPPPSEPAPWRLISIKGQSVPHEIPMSPITMMRNELISQGGSGIPIDRSSYLSSVEYWQGHASIL